MITDAQLVLSDAQALTVTAASTNQIDLTVARNLGRSGAQSNRIIVQVPVALVGGTSVTATVRQSANANMSSPDIIATGPTVLTAALVAGAKLLDIPWPGLSGLAAKRYIDVNYTVVGTYSGGSVNAFIVDDSDGGHYLLGNTGR